MTNTENIVQNREGECPVCHCKMEHASPHSYYCKTCQQKYEETYFCPNCERQLEQIKGCGSINYLCKVDGLISSSKVKFYYQKTKF